MKLQRLIGSRTHDFYFFVPALAGFSEHATVVGYCVVSQSVTLRITAGQSNRRMVPAFSDGPRSISLAWRKQVENVQPGTPRETQGIGSKLWPD